MTYIKAPLVSPLLIFFFTYTLKSFPAQQGFSSLREISQYFIFSQVWFCQTAGLLSPSRRKIFLPQPPVFISTSRTNTSPTTSSFPLTKLARVTEGTTFILTWETATPTSPALTMTWVRVSAVGSSPPSHSPSSWWPSPSLCLSASRWSRSTRGPSSSDWADFSMEVRRDLVSRACHVLFVCY